jgi:cyclophilin family peptidyl-prolyl cis-trans isomerase/HEAT repeat protein
MYRSASTLPPLGSRYSNRLPPRVGARTLATLALIAACAAACGAACATVPPPAPPTITWEEKLAWMMRLEDARILRHPNPPPPLVLKPSSRREPAIVAPPPPSDLLRLMRDSEARVRRRAALAAGRVGLAEAVPALSALLEGDQDPEVRQMAAFALGLIGDPSARPALQAALAQPSPLVQGRAAEALGLIGNDTDPVASSSAVSAAISQMVRTHVQAGALAGVAADDLTYPMPPQAEAVRLGLYALVRLRDFGALAAAALDAQGRPVSQWWPIAYALQRIEDAKAAPALLALLNTEGRYTASFAAKGLGGVNAVQAGPALTAIVTERRRDAAVVVQSIRALAAINDVAAVPAVTAIVRDGAADPGLRVEALAALGTLRASPAIDVLLDLLSDPAPAVRGGAMRALAAIDPDTFLSALSGLDPDRDWTVRAAQAAALATLGPERAQPRLTTMLRDTDQRVLPAVLTALVAMKAPEAADVLVAHLTAQDFALRAAAASGLGELKVASAVPALSAAFRSAHGEDSYVARAAMLAAVAKIDPAAARPLLEEALKDRDWAVRVRAMTLLREAGVAPDAAAIRPAPAVRSMTDRELAWASAPPYSPQVYIETTRGTIHIELAVLDAPMTVVSFIDLARKGFFNGVPIHRVVPDFVVQDGDPRGDGEGGPGYTLRDEINQRPYLRGTVGMALDWKDTGGSQFFIAHSPQPHLDGRYTVFGSVVKGMEVVDRIQPRDVITSIRIWDGVTMTQP